MHHHDDERPACHEGLSLIRLAEGFGFARAVQLAAELDIAGHLGDGPHTADDLATATSCHPGALYRLLRVLSAEGLFTEDPPGTFGLTPTSDRLRADHPQSLRSWVLFQGLFNTVYAGAIHSIRTGGPTFPVVFGQPIFEYLDGHPEQAAIFNAAMSQHSRIMAEQVAQAYDLSQARLIVDVGGGDGTFLSGLLGAWPDVRGVVLDLPHAQGAAHKQLASAGLGERCTFVGGDFLRDVPAGGDVYLLKGILHNWPDDDAAVILRNCRRAMRADGRVTLFEWLVPTDDTPHPSKLIDLSMLTVYGGRERTEPEFARLFQSAGLRLSRVVQSPPLTAVEAVPAAASS
jgi:SAM-dependent methyltransferase